MRRTTKLLIFAAVFLGLGTLITLRVADRIPTGTERGNFLLFNFHSPDKPLFDKPLSCGMSKR
jgi:hypothetical protein